MNDCKISLECYYNLFCVSYFLSQRARLLILTTLLILSIQIKFKLNKYKIEIKIK